MLWHGCIVIAYFALFLYASGGAENSRWRLALLIMLTIVVPGLGLLLFGVSGHSDEVWVIGVLGALKSPLWR